MIACLLIPGFELRAALRKQPGLALRPAALSPVAGTEPMLGPVTAEAERLRRAPGYAARGSAGNASGARPGRAGSCRGRAGMGGDPACARRHGLRSRSGRR